MDTEYNSLTIVVIEQQFYRPFSVYFKILFIWLLKVLALFGFILVVCALYRRFGSYFGDNWPVDHEDNFTTRVPFPNYTSAINATRPTYISTTNLPITTSIVTINSTISTAKIVPFETTTVAVDISRDSLNTTMVPVRRTTKPKANWNPI